MSTNEYKEAVSKLSNQIEQSKALLSSTSQSLPIELNWWSTTNAMTMCVAILLFGAMICGISAYLLRHGQSSDSILKTFGTILIVIAALFLVVAGYSDQQIAPVMGLLGTIAGYLLGKNTNDSKT